MKKYNEPKIEIKKFEKEKILTVSGFVADIDGGKTSFKSTWTSTPETVLEYK